MGDFNEILHSSKKMGGRSKSEKQMQGFQEALVNGNLIDLGHSGDFFTWSNKQEDDTFTKERLDRF